MTRFIRDNVFCWAEKKILRLLRSKYEKKDLVDMKYLYFILTEIDNDFNGKPMKYFTKTIATYSGLPKEFIPTGLKELEKLNIIKIVEERENGKFKGKQLLFTPGLIEDKPVEKNTPKISISRRTRKKGGFAVSGFAVNGKHDPSEQSLNKNKVFLSPDEKEERKPLPTEEEEVLKTFSQEYEKIYGGEYSVKPRDKKLLSAYKKDLSELAKDFGVLSEYIQYLVEHEKLNGLKYITLSLFLSGNNDRLTKLHSFRLYETDDLQEIQEVKASIAIEEELNEQENINNEYIDLEKQIDLKEFYTWAEQDENRKAKWNKYKSYKPLLLTEKKGTIELMKEFLEEQPCVF